MRHLSGLQAKQIINRIIRIVPHNVNIADSEGVIVASYKPEHIGKVSMRALHAMELEEACIVYRDNGEDKKGIHFPIRFENKIVGVVEINGELDDIMQIGQMVVIIAELMLENDAFHEMSATKERRMNDFFYEWTRRKEDYDDRLKMMADVFGINLQKKRVAVIVQMRRSRFSVIDQVCSQLRAGDYLVRQSIDSFMLLLEDGKSLHARINRVMEISEDFESCYIGLPDQIVYRSVKQADRTREIAQTLGYSAKMVHYAEIDMECMIADLKLTPELISLMEIFEEQDKDETLRSTIAVYVRCGENHKEVCNRLFIHRNTLNYRLEKIQILTGRNPRNARDIMILYTAAVALKLGRHSEKT